MEQVKNMQGLIKDLSTCYKDLRGKKMSVEDAKAIANMAGKLIRAAGAQLEYNEHMKTRKKISFFE